MARDAMMRELEQWRSGKRDCYWLVEYSVPETEYRSAYVKLAHVERRAGLKHMLRTLKVAGRTIVRIRRVTVGPAKPKEAK